MTFGLAITRAARSWARVNSTDGRAASAPPGAGLPAVALPALGGPRGGLRHQRGRTDCRLRSSTAAGQQQPFRIESGQQVTPIVPFEGPAWDRARPARLTRRARRRPRHQRPARSARSRSTRARPGQRRHVRGLAGEHGRIDCRGDVAVGWFISLADGASHAFVNTADGSADLNTLITPGSGLEPRPGVCGGCERADRRRRAA